tara:strand:+ start:32 stop:526 length:495 start_codon:yes stop_codon:yes gene_type:complete
MIYYIYEVPTEKNGATKDWEERRAYNFEQYQIEPIIVETMEGPDTLEYWQVVGDREWYYADLNGYPRGTHYLEMRIKAAKHDWSDTARATAKLNGSQSKAGLVGGAKTMELSKIPGTAAYIADRKRKSNGGSVTGNREYTCPYCGKVGKGGRMKGHINSKFCQS